MYIWLTTTTTTSTPATIAYTLFKCWTENDSYIYLGINYFIIFYGSMVHYKLEHIKIIYHFHTEKISFLIF